MALEKAHSSSRKMTFGENRDLERVVIASVPSGKIKRVNVNFNEDKHTRFKAACVRNGTSITDVINQLVDNWLKENE
ncbi:DNA partition complex ParG [Salmonella enterica subsp. enterica serovar Newport]|uniref:DNA partition complex ParG n=1 Tax=Salmonella enterica TaxID=28901 RepID=A0A756IHF2_SALER|nr:DNA partition complex ParG [Salmonella enterica subsp. diarizonae]EJQ8147152.1 DNA partition complex ParG [Salmonella enterica subsp. enterica serovar Newport]HAF6280242.1 DNA partition complex ParG [Salmonella enterica]EJW0496324.1 DNA partition complex ParG [Salmonella enterica subsp. enterica serovar Newport]ELA5318056.1 DNA partition complex ParG [Salmonella enterica subsp. enterica serovar Newport]